MHLSRFFPESVSAIVNKMANFKRSNFASEQSATYHFRKTVLWCN